MLGDVEGVEHPSSGSCFPCASAVVTFRLPGLSTVFVGVSPPQSGKKDAETPPDNKRGHPTDMIDPISEASASRARHQPVHCYRKQGQNRDTETEGFAERLNPVC